MTEDSLKVVESFARLIGRCNNDANRSLCMKCNRKFRPILISENTSKQDDAAEEILSACRPLYKAHREDILSKDFSFLTPTEGEKEGNFIINGFDIGFLYVNILEDADADEEQLKRVNNELLCLFYFVAPSDDKKLLNTKFRKKKAPVKNSPPLAKQLEKLLQNNKQKLKKAENDPSAITGVVADLFKNNSDDMANMLSGMLGDMGISSSK